MTSRSDQAELKPTTTLLTLEGTDTNEDDLLEMISSLEARLCDVRELHREQQDLEDELEGLHADLDARAAELDEREHMLGESSTEIESERGSIEESRAAIAAQQAELERRRAELEAKEQQIGERFSSVDQMQAKLEAAEAALRTEREKRQAEAEAFRREQAELAARERELAAQAAKVGNQAPEIAALATQLAEAQKLANQRAEEAERRANEAHRRTLELEGRCKELAGECEVVRRELKGSREQVKRVEQELPARLMKRQLRAQQTDTRLRTVLTALTWLCVAATMGAAGLAGSNGAAPDAVTMLGLAFAAFFVGAQALAGRLFDAPGVVIGGIGASFGWWFPLWTRAVVQALETWSLPVEALPVSVAAQLPLAVSVATATLTLTVGLFALTWSGSLLFQTGFVSLLAGALALFPDSSGFALGAAAVIWVAVTGTGLTRWANRVWAENAPTIGASRPVTLDGRGF